MMGALMSRLRSNAILGALAGLVSSNPVTVVCLAAIGLSLCSFYWPTYSQSQGFRSEVSTRNDALSKVKSLNQTPMILPPEYPDDPPRTILVAMRPPVIQKVAGVYGGMDTEHKEVYRRATAINRGEHKVMLEGLFPEAVDENIPFNAQGAYTEGLTHLYKLLDAGTPPTAEEVDLLLESEQTAFINRIVPTPTNLTEQQSADLAKKQADKLLKAYQATAGNIHVYANPPKIDATTDLWDPGIFQASDWVKSATKPDMFNIWEGQMQLWIQQDLVTAIALANDAANPETSVLDQPVKRILSMAVRKEYVGIAAVAPTAGGAPPGSAAQTTATTTPDLNKRLEDDYSFSLTGRRSNHIYDVRYADMSLLVESRQLPKLLNAIGQVNFMTVIGMQIKDQDEFAMLSGSGAEKDGGYFLGKDVDVVQVDLTIETIWLRSWTAGHDSEEAARDLNEPFDKGLMPDLIRDYLGLKARAANFGAPGRGITGTTP